MTSIRIESVHPFDRLFARTRRNENADTWRTRKEVKSDK